MSEEEYTAEDYERAINELTEQLSQVESDRQKTKESLAATTHSAKEGNLISYQLDSAELLAKLEHFYRGDILVIDEDGTRWQKQKNKDLVPFNEYGVSVMMETVTKYIDKNTSLSRYKEERIYEILADLGEELTLVVYCNYEKMGMDTYFKKTRFRAIIVTTLHMIESIYRRALDGKTSEELNQSRIVTQSDAMRGPISSSMMAPKKKSHWWNPRGW